MTPVLMAVPNISCGRDPAVIESVGRAYVEAGAVLLDTHSDVDHDRSVHTLAGRQGVIASALAAGARVARRLIDLRSNLGVHPHVGVLDVAPVVHLGRDTRGSACAEALTAAAMIGDLERIPVFTYGVLSGGRKRAEIRAGGVAGLTASVEVGAVRPDFGPAVIDPHVGATMVGARAPMVAFNLVMDGSVGLERAREVAAAVREGGSAGLPGVRALGLELRHQGVVQVSANLERPGEAGIAELHRAVASMAPVSHGELVGLAPAAVLERIPAGLELPGLDPVMKSIEGSLRFHSVTD